MTDPVATLAHLREIKEHVLAWALPDGDVLALVALVEALVERIKTTHMHTSRVGEEACERDDCAAWLADPLVRACREGAKP